MARLREQLTDEAICAPDPPSPWVPCAYVGETPVAWIHVRTMAIAQITPPYPGIPVEQPS